MNPQMRPLAQDMRSLTPAQLLGGAHLGDVLVLPDGRALTIRAAVGLPGEVAGLAGMVVLGELTALLQVPTGRASMPLLQPLGYLPAAMTGARELACGEMSYLPPHAPHDPGATGALLWRLVAVPGHADPLVLVYRGREVIAFVHSGAVPAAQMRVVPLRREYPQTDGTPAPTRTAAVVHSSSAEVRAAEQPLRRLGQ